MLGMNYQNIQSGLSTAFLDKNISSNVLYRPQFISNDYKNGRKVLSTIEDELLHCDSFLISVAFITMGGISTLTSNASYSRRNRHPCKDSNYGLFGI